MDSRDFITPSPGNTNESGYEGSPEQSNAEDQQSSMPPPDFMASSSGAPPMFLPPMEHGAWGSYPAMEAWGPMPTAADQYYWQQAGLGPMPPPMGPAYFQPPPASMHPSAYYQSDSVPPAMYGGYGGQGPVPAQFYVPYPAGQWVSYPPPEFQQELQEAGLVPPMAGSEQQQQLPQQPQAEFVPGDLDESQWSELAHAYADAAAWEEQWSQHMPDPTGIADEPLPSACHEDEAYPCQQPPNAAGDAFEWACQQGSAAPSNNNNNNVEGAAPRVFVIRPPSGRINFPPPGFFLPPPSVMPYEGFEADMSRSNVVSN